MLKHVTLVVVVTLFSAAEADAQVPSRPAGKPPVAAPANSHANRPGTVSARPGRRRVQRAQRPVQSEAVAPFEIQAAPTEVDALATPIRDPEVFFAGAGRVVHAFCNPSVNTSSHQQSQQDQFICNNLSGLTLQGLAADSHGGDAVRLLQSVATNYGYGLSTSDRSYLGALNAAESICSQALRRSPCPMPAPSSLRRNPNVAEMQAYVADVISMVLYTTSANFRHFNNEDFQRLIVTPSEATGEEADEEEESVSIQSENPLDFLENLARTPTTGAQAIQREEQRRETLRRAGRPLPSTEPEFTYELGPAAPAPRAGHTESEHRE